MSLRLQARFQLIGVILLEAASLNRPVFSSQIGSAAGVDLM